MLNGELNSCRQKAKWTTKAPVYKDVSKHDMKAFGIESESSEYLYLEVFYFASQKKLKEAIKYRARKNGPPRRALPG